LALILLLELGFMHAAGAAPAVYVANGDCTGLRNAIDSATPGRQTTIILMRSGTYADCGANVGHDSVLIEGAGATLTTQFCRSTLVQTSAGAQLTLRNMSIATPSGCGMGPPSPVIANSGDMELDAVSITGPFVRNDSVATLTLRNVTTAAPVANGGTLNIYNSTLAPGPDSVRNDGGAHLVLANSIAFGFAGGMFGAPCAISGEGATQSLGGNLYTGTCSWITDADRRGLSVPGLGLLQDNGGLVPTQALSSQSPARRIGAARYCEPFDARGLARVPGTCDAGAYEFDGGSQKVVAGGVNGTFYDHAADGHYVTIQRLHDNTLLVFWNTFDRNGNPAWIYGVGEIVDRHVHVDMSQNVGGRLQPGGPASGSHATPWGSVDIDLAGCLVGTFRYQSALNTFGSGEFPLNRLASFADIGCVD